MSTSPGQVETVSTQHGHVNVDGGFICDSQNTATATASPGGRLAEEGAVCPCHWRLRGREEQTADAHSWLGLRAFLVTEKASFKRSLAVKVHRRKSDR